MTDVHARPTRRRLLARCRDWPVTRRCGTSAALVGGLAALPAAGLPVVPEGQPFLLVLGIFAAALLFGRIAALFSALVATAAGAFLLLPSAGPMGDGAVRAGLSLIAFTVVAIGLASAVESMRRMGAVMAVADSRRAQRRTPPRMDGPTGTKALLVMTPEERLRRFERSQGGD